MIEIGENCRKMHDLTKPKSDLLYVETQNNTSKQRTWFLPICQNQIQGLFKDLQGPYEGYIQRTKLTQTGTFISIYKQVQFTLDNITPPSINQNWNYQKNLPNALIAAD